MTNNGEIYTIIMEKLNFEPRLDGSNLTVLVEGDHDIIVLGGKVSSYNEAFIAEQAVKSLKNVRSVVNEIEVELATKQAKSDVEIAKAVIHALKFCSSVPHEHIQSVIKDGVVTLSGEVQYQYQKNNTLSAIRDIAGIKSVINKIVVKSPDKVDADKVKEHIIREFERHARIDADKIEVRAEGNRVILTGKVPSFREIDEAEDAAWSTPGVKIVENNITIGC